MTGAALLNDLLQAAADLSLLGGWSSEEVLNAMRKALADSGETLRLSRDETASRLGVSRRVLPKWSGLPLPARGALDMVFAIRAKLDEDVDAGRALEFAAAAKDLAKLGLLRRRPLELTQETQMLLERAAVLARGVATCLENTRAQPKLGSRVGAEPEPTQPQPGHVHSSPAAADPNFLLEGVCPPRNS